MKTGMAWIGIFQKMRIKNLSGVSEVRFKKTRLLHLGNVEKPPHPQLSAQQAWGLRKALYLENFRKMLKIHRKIQIEVSAQLGLTQYNSIDFILSARKK